MLQKSRKHFKIGPYGLVASFLIATAIILRIILIQHFWPQTNSDEGTMGIMALHIANGSDFPAFFYGQNYMGALEAYISAGLFHIFGPSLFPLRLSLVILFMFVLIVMYRLTSFLYTKGLALVTLLLLVFGTYETFTRQLKALGGAEETLLFGALMLLLASRLAYSFYQEEAHFQQRKRNFLYGCLGLVIGLGIWSHMLTLPIVTMALLLLLLFCRSELRSRNGLLLLVGCLLGLLPLIIYNIAFPEKNFIGTLWQVHNNGGTGAEIQAVSIWNVVRGTVLVAVPMATGAYPLCSLPDQPGEWSAHLSSCM
ncbi:MAG: glycosyltransferase family 39 protein, partial [Chloroflexota bacterium]|nr:glycosyltransferase family 39 protein [Chloroflexota bacterium]